LLTIIHFNGMEGKIAECFVHSSETGTATLYSNSDKYLPTSTAQMSSMLSTLLIVTY